MRLLTELRQQMSAELTRSDVLRALIWPIAGLLLLLSASIGAKADQWVLVTIFVLLSLFLLLYSSAYVFFALTDPDALRSEKYKLQKIAIEQGLFGDSLSGLKKVTQDEDPAKLLDAAPSVASRHD